MNDSFILYTSDYQLIEGLTDAQLGQLTRALYIYARDGEQIHLEPVVRMAFVFIKDKIDRNMDKYQKKCERLRANAKKRWEEKQKQPNECKSMQLHTKANNCMQIDSDSVSDRVSDSVSDSVSDAINNDSNSNNKPPKGGNSKSKTEVLTLEAPDAESSEKRKPELDCTAVKDYWNEQHDKTSSAMRRLTLMSGNRKTMLRARLRQCKGDESMIYKAIDMAMGSDFMNGNNSRGWIACFDWIFGNENNFAKTLEGYDDNPARPPRNKQQPQQPQSLENGRQSIGDRYKQAESKKVSETAQDNKYRTVISSMLLDLKKNPNNHAAKESLARFYDAGVLQRLGIDWKPE